MEPRIRERYNEPVQKEVLRRYGITSQPIRALDAVENFVYAYERYSQPFILRVSHSLRRSQALIEGEVDFINYLAAGGISVSPAVPSDAGNLVEIIEDGQGGQFLATAFVRAQGRPPDSLWTPDLYERLGMLMGKMHALAVDYQPANPTRKRPAWDDEIMDFPRCFLPETEIIAKLKYQALSKHARMLAVEPRYFGLTHFDIHSGNCLVDGAGRLTIFDFDDCTYTWYVNDLAIAVGNLAGGKPDAPNILKSLFRGYLCVYPLDYQWLREIPAFLRMGEIFYLAVLYRDMGDRQAADPNVLKVMRDLKHTIEHDIPTFDFDFENFLKSL